MASPQPPYAPPGPSTYYQQHPHPHYVYGNQSPGPYPYQYSPVPPPMNSHPSMHPSASPRLNGPARSAYVPSSSNRGGHAYPAYPPVHYPHTPPPPPLHSYPPHNYPQPQLPYSPSYTIQSTSPYSPAWSMQQQPISPLPKQLSMPPPFSPTAPPFEPSRQEGSSPEEASHAPQTPESRSELAGNQQASPQSSSLQQTSPNISHSTAVANRTGTWAIWSRRPRDPAHAPGIIISPLARPPQDVVENALELPSPPPSPPPPLSKALPVNPEPSPQEATPERVDAPLPSTTETTPACSTVPDTSMPASPISSNTSVSIAVQSPVQEKLVVAQLSPNVETTVLPAVEKSSLHSDTSVPSVLSTSSEAPVQPQTVEVTAAPSPPKGPPPPKKLWSSLLRPTASSSKSNLPTSSVVGFSIPGVPNAQSSTSASVSPAVSAQKSDLLTLLTGTPVPGPPMRVRPRGLVNSGNMCFANAVLQVLVYCPQFYSFFTELGRHLPGPVVGGGVGIQGEGARGTPLVDATVQFLKEFTPPSDVKAEADPGRSAKARGKEAEDRDSDDEWLDSFIPANVYDALKEKKRFDNMRGGQQEDAEEFLGFFLDTLEEELLSIVNTLSPSKPTGGPVEEHNEDEPPHEDGWLEVGKRNRMAVTRTIKTAESPITKIFGGTSRSTLRAPQQKDSVVIEDWRSLRLDIQHEQIHTVRDALQYLSHPQSVQVAHSSKVGVTVDASQQTLVDSLPPILILHMKRFLYDTDVKDVVKVGKQILFPPELDSADLVHSRKASTTKYKLFGALYHHGLSASGGHYTIDVLHPNRDLSTKPREAWIRIDDELVSDVRPEDVFGGQVQDDRCAYLLFYRRVEVVPRT